MSFAVAKVRPQNAQARGLRWQDAQLRGRGGLVRLCSYFSRAPVPAMSYERARQSARAAKHVRGCVKEEKK